jgi:hypothetical protein
MSSNPVDRGEVYIYELSEKKVLADKVTEEEVTELIDGLGLSEFKGTFQAPHIVCCISKEIRLYFMSLNDEEYPLISV